MDWEDVHGWNGGAIRLRRGAEALKPLQLLSNEIPLAQDVLDRQIVDTDDAKVERVNDLHLLRARGELRVAHVDHPDPQREPAHRTVTTRVKTAPSAWTKLPSGVWTCTQTWSA